MIRARFRVGEIVSIKKDSVGKSVYKGLHNKGAGLDSGKNFLITRSAVMDVEIMTGRNSSQGTTTSEESDTYRRELVSSRQLGRTDSYRRLGLSWDRNTRRLVQSREPDYTRVVMYQVSSLTDEANHTDWIPECVFTIRKRYIMKGGKYEDYK